MSFEYQINDLYASVQGEGAQVGRPVVFVRLAHCNLACHFCDTKFDSVLCELTPDQLISRIASDYADVKSVLITGGEPTIRNLYPLVKELDAAGYWIGIETNGTRRINQVDNALAHIDHITFAPKASMGWTIETCHEIRIPVQKWVSVSLLQRLERAYPQAMWRFLSPIEIDGHFDIESFYKLISEANREKIKWLMSVQTHKLAGIK